MLKLSMPWEMFIRNFSNKYLYEIDVASEPTLIIIESVRQYATNSKGDV